MKTAKQLRETAQARRKRYDKDKIEGGWVRISGWAKSPAHRDLIHAYRDELAVEVE